MHGVTRTANPSRYACDVHTHTTNYTSPRHSVHSTLNVLPRGAMHPSRVAHTSPGSQTQKCSCRHLTSHTQCHVAHRPETFPPLGTRPTGRDYRLTAHMHMPRPRCEKGGRRREREGSHALAEEDGRERVVLADWRHVVGGLVCGVGELVPPILSR